MKESAKKILSCLLAVLMLVCAVPMASSAAGTTSGQCGDNVYWTLDENGTLTISGEGDMWNYQYYYMEDMDKGHEYPTYSENKTVEYEDFGANHCDTKVKKVIIENGVTSIGAYAFECFLELKEVEIPDSVEIIEGSAFSYCFNLIDVSIGNGVACINQYSFSQCRKLKEILIPDNVTSIYDDAFSCCYNLENVSIGKGAEYIGLNAFSYCNIKRLTIDSRNSNYCSQNNVIFNRDKTELIECYNNEISNYIIPDTVVTINDYAFNDCNHLTDITIPDSVTEIEYGVFEGCQNLKNVNIGNGVKSIGNSAFLSCESLTSIVIPSKVTFIEEDTFYGCENLMSITIPNTVNQIGEAAFDGCNNLKDIYYLGTEKKWNEINIGDYNDSLINAMLHYCNHNNITEYNLQPATCEENGHTEGLYCNDCKTWLSGKTILSFGHSDNDSNNICDTCGINLKITKRGYTGNVNWILYEDGTLKLYGGVWTGSYDLDYSDFYYLSDYITDIIIEDGVEYLGYGVFLGCNKAESITIPSSIDSIGEAAFGDCSNLKCVYYNGTQKQWNNISIQEYNYDLTSATIHFMSEELPETSGQCGDNAYWFLDESTGTLSITGSGEMWNYGYDWDEYAPWCDYCDYIKSVSISGLTSIGREAFYCCTSLASITISNSVTNIGDGAFSSCTSLANITIPDSVTSISKHAFSGCTNLTSITIPDSVTSIGDEAFGGCANLTSITIPDSVTSIGEAPFYGCSGMLSIDVDSNNPCYSNDENGILFDKQKTRLIQYLCSENKSVYTIPNSVISIDNFALMGCSNLTSITIPNSVTSIGDSAFEDCTSLTSITIPDSVTTISAYAFYGCTGLASITIPESVTIIDDSVFCECNSLESVTIPNSVTSICDQAFRGCTSLSSITIPDSVTSISSYAFDGCTSLKDVYYTGSESQWKNIPIEIDNDCLINASIHYNYVIHEHAYISTITKSATCTETGIKTFTCDCGDSYTETIPAPGHVDENDNGVCDACSEQLKKEDNSFIAKLKAFFQRIIEWLKNLFKFGK